MLYRQERNCSKRDLFIIIIIFVLLFFLFFVIFILLIFILVFLLLLLLLALLGLGNYFFACINLPFGPVCSDILGGEKQEESLLKFNQSRAPSNFQMTLGSQLQFQQRELRPSTRRKRDQDPSNPEGYSGAGTRCLRLLRNLHWLAFRKGGTAEPASP